MAGERVLLPDGSVGLLPDGSVAISDASGNCSDCCGGTAVTCDDYPSDVPRDGSGAIASSGDFAWPVVDISFDLTAATVTTATGGGVTTAETITATDLDSSDNSFATEDAEDDDGDGFEVIGNLCWKTGTNDLYIIIDNIGAYLVPGKHLLGTASVFITGTNGLGGNTYTFSIADGSFTYDGNTFRFHFHT